MGRLIKNHWARLIILAAAAYQCAGALEGFFWPKFFFDFLTKNFDHFVKPIPILQIINMVFGLFILGLEWPLSFIAGSSMHRSFQFRIFVYPLSSLFCALLYQGMDAALYYLIGIAVYMWAYSEGELIGPVPWSLPKLPTPKSRMVKA